jgi:hypothetical protein
MSSSPMRMWLPCLWLSLVVHTQDIYLCMATGEIHWVWRPNLKTGGDFNSGEPYLEKWSGGVIVDVGDLMRETRSGAMDNEGEPTQPRPRRS